VNLFPCLLAANLSFGTFFSFVFNLINVCYIVLWQLCVDVIYTLFKGVNLFVVVLLGAEVHRCVEWEDVLLVEVLDTFSRRPPWLPACTRPYIISVEGGCLGGTLGPKFQYLYSLIAAAHFCNSPFGPPS